ncbi:MAG: hypothetical protein OEZ13_01880 [Spirochaetia bacterium]|nr:hypothetical protein [Spirochaetia bacterium]
MIKIKLCIYFFAAFLFLTACMPPGYNKTITLNSLDSVLEEFTIVRIQYNLYQSEVPSNAELLAQIALKRGYSVQLFFDTFEKENKSMYKRLLKK